MKSKLWKIIRMEFRLTAANRAFIVLTILGPFLIAAVTVLPSVLSMKGGLGGNTELAIAVVNADPQYLEGLRAPLAKNGIRVFEAQGATEFLDAEVLAGSFDGYLVLPPDLTSSEPIQYVSKNVSDFRLTGILQGTIGQSVVALRLLHAGLPAEKIATITQPPLVQIRQISKSGEKQNRDFLTILMTGLMLAMVLYMTTLLYGQAIGRSVLTEKTSKTVEIMLSSVRPLDLMFGKILGKAAASLLQYGVWVSLTAVFIKFFGPRLGVSIDFGGSLSMLGFLVLYFVLAFFLYCSLYAALGASSQDEQHFGQLSWPLILFLVLPIVMISPIIMSPHAPLIVGMSLFPLTAPVVMFLRIVVGGVPTWQILASIALILATTGAVIVLSAKIFRVGLLMTGKRFKLGEVLRWLRY
ncbi:MAG: ABC transporter permease [Spirochaetes bacterium]|nr:ABC transporter permease [Spirochaetota bacterium]